MSEFSGMLGFLDLFKWFGRSVVAEADNVKLNTCTLTLQCRFRFSVSFYSEPSPTLACCSVNFIMLTCFPKRVVAKFYFALIYMSF